MAKVYQSVPGNPNAPPSVVEVPEELFQQLADLAAKNYLDANSDVEEYIRKELADSNIPVTQENLYNQARIHFVNYNRDKPRPGTEGFRQNLTYAGVGAAPGGTENPSPFTGENAQTFVTKIDDLGFGDPTNLDFSPTGTIDPASARTMLSGAVVDGDTYQGTEVAFGGPGGGTMSNMPDTTDSDPDVREETVIPEGPILGFNRFPPGDPRNETAEYGTPDPTPPIPPAPPAPPAGNVNTQMDGAMNTGQSIGNLLGNAFNAGMQSLPGGNVVATNNQPPVNTATTTPSPDFSQYLNQDQTGIRPELQVDLSNFEKDYLAANPDVAQAVGNIPGGGIQHYFDYGKQEGRSGASPALQNLTPLDYQALTANPNDPNLSPEVRDRMLAGFKARDVGRATGYQGVFTGLEGGENYDRFKTAVGSRSNFADAYGRQTALGREEEQRDAPSLIKGTFDEEQYLKDNPDVAQAVRAGTLSSGKEHYDAFGVIEGRAKPTEGGTELNLQRLKANPNEFLDAKNYNIDPTRFGIDAKTAAIDTARDAVKTKVGDFTAQERYNLVAKENIEAAQQKELSDKVNAQKGIVSKDATVQGQLESLMAQFDGGEIPAFAAGAIRTAEQRLAARGMGASSMAGAAIVQAAMEASTPIAAADAETYRRMQELNLNNRQQAEVLNAQMSLQLDVANLNNEQQARVTNVANRVQSLFTDQAAINSSRQFNAANEQQNDQFFANLFNDTAKFNTAQTNGLRQFNAGQENAIEQFNSTLADNREQFNQKNAIIIDQANAVYRRNINTSNTAIANAEAEYNTRNLFNISQNAQNRLLQEQRDQINFARVNSLNETAFQNNLALSSYAFDRDLELAGDIATGSVVGDLLGSAFDAGFKALPGVIKSFQS